jgi:hypothetical protein
MTVKSKRGGAAKLVLPTTTSPPWSLVIGQTPGQRLAVFDQSLKVGHVLDENQVKNDISLDFVFCRDCPNFKRFKRDKKTGRCVHMPGSIVSEECGCFGGRANTIVI